MKENNFFAMMSRMKYINRWVLMRNTTQENDCVHSLEVAMIAHALGVIRNTYFDGNVNAERLALIGMYHDATEIITGDMPTPIKYRNPAIKAAYKAVEGEAGEELLEGLPKEMQDVYRPLLGYTEDEKELWKIVKAADKISAYIKCVEEQRMGNREFEKAGESIKEIITDMHMPEVNYFMEKFMPAYMLTLDELR